MPLGAVCNDAAPVCTGPNKADYDFAWVDLIDSGTGTRIDNGEWMQNDDDGWFHVDLPFDFHWFGQVERRITIGTNGVLTFGAGQLPYGSSEPVPCAYGDDGVQVDAR